ncbi:MAG: hypothetical protein IJ443_02680, partial [Firmicutes bacterium]|nr:hypothetical protein [Bacillota bacterium]
MKKLLCALLSVMMVVTMMPVIAFAEDSVQTGPGQLYWAAVPENADPGTVPSDITWMDNNHPVSMETNGTLFVYFGIDVDGTITPLTAALLNYNTGGGVEVSECDGYIYKLTSASGSAQTWIQYVTETQDYEIGAIVNGGNSGGHNTEEKWAMIFSDVVIDGGNTPSKMSDIATGVRISGASSSANYYLYLVKFDDSDNIQEIEEVTTTSFEIKYLRGNPDHIDGTGLKIIKADDGIDGTENYYSFLTDKSLQADYDIGEGMYDVWPRAEGDNRLIYNSWIDTSESNTGGSGRPTEPYDIFVLSSRADLASLTEEQIKNEDDFAIIEASLTHENRTFTGYAYVATREYINERWVYTGFRTIAEGETIYADYSAGNDQWVDSVNGTVTGLTWGKNTDGTYTFTHHGENTDEVKVNGESTYGYSVGLYENVPEGIYYTCECM